MHLFSESVFVLTSKMASGRAFCPAIRHFRGIAARRLPASGTI